MGRLRLTGAKPEDPIQIDSQILSDPADLTALRRCVEFAREVGNAKALRGFVKREVMPTALTSTAMDNFIRDGVTTIWHQSCTAKMRRDGMSVVDSSLKVYGVDRLRIADASVMPRFLWLTPWLRASSSASRRAGQSPVNVGFDFLLPAP